MEKKYYWLKLDKNFFKRHDIRIIEAMPNGKDYVLFYLKLLVESVDHNGMLRFSEAIPYDETMLSIVTNTNVDVVRSAITAFTHLKMIELMDDKTIFMLEVKNMTGYETKWAEKKRNQRKKVGQTGDNVLGEVDNVPNSEDNVLSKVDIVRQEKEKELEKELEIEKEIKDIVVTAVPTSPVPHQTLVIDTFEMQCVEMLIESCIETFPKARVPKDPAGKSKWALEIDRMKRIDKLSEDEIRQALDFAIHDGFWKSNIRSTKKFREKFETLYSQSNRGNNRNPSQRLQGVADRLNHLEAQREEEQL